MVKIFWLGLICAGAALADSASTPDHVRALGLEGAANFRDLGGYSTADFHRVRWGRVFRSNSLDKLTPADASRVGNLGLAAVVDLRTAEERTQSPSIWLIRPADLYESPKPTLKPIMVTILKDAQTAQGARAGMDAFYASMPNLYRDEYSAMFHRIAAGELPLLVHCTAGKDRTGVAAAVLLRAVGVPRPTVVEDYELTDRVVPAPTGGAAHAQAAVAQLPPESRLALWQAREEYIDSALDAIDREYGSIDGYLTLGLGLSKGEVLAIRKQLTE